MEAPDASLQWLITANFNYKKLSNNSYYDLIINSPPIWNSGEIQLPETYYIDIKGKIIDKLYFTDYDPLKWYNPVNNEGFLVYYGHNHFEDGAKSKLTLIGANSFYLAYKTKHGVILKKGKIQMIRLGLRIINLS